MACRIGMTTNPDLRKAYWANEHPTLTDWRILAGPYNSKATAQDQETALALIHGCESSPGGDDPDSPGSLWYVYRFNY